MKAGSMPGFACHWISTVLGVKIAEWMNKGNIKNLTSPSQQILVLSPPLKVPSILESLFYFSTRNKEGKLYLTVKQYFTLNLKRYFNFTVSRFTGIYYYQWLVGVVVQSCPALSDPMDCSTPGCPVLYCLLELAQMNARWGGDASGSPPLKAHRVPHSALSVLPAHSLLATISWGKYHSYPLFLKKAIQAKLVFKAVSLVPGSTP